MCVKGNSGLIDLKKTPLCDVGMHYGNFRENSVKIENNKKPSDAFRKTPGAFR